MKERKVRLKIFAEEQNNNIKLRFCEINQLDSQIRNH